ncbi:RNA polymerase sigma factor [Leptospira interrogans]|uniref:RNA polymerase sigma factor n=3 Tax=Leptospira interrogans TaxID=173 RepID=A0AAP9WI94_LEPIR|nr:RNA polymerase sigma factor [Leptospira interrogans]EMM84161.1 sigma-70, region 4 [Leptospira interrogans str. 2006001854]QCO35598.1 RNA polymerase sigma factor [Leptospira interrogans]QOI44924.1 RNA polymerase sigma factor [Leptospira interrogans serovar Canicola]QOI53264.1 RNA polymerase sigma factor [Leptospira interrogans serovar Bataviae]UMQ52670.1 RNA polymerase sigma factor [Leptospira interrogans]
MTNRSNEEFRRIIDGCILSNESSWREFIQRYDRILTGTIVNQNGKDDAEDIFQKVLIKLVENEFRLLRNFKGTTEAEFRSYIIQIVRNTLRNEYKSHSRRRESSFIENEELDRALIRKSWEVWEITETNRLYHEMISNFEDLILNLDLKSREVIYFRFRGLKFREISEILGMNLNTIISLHNRALKKIKAFKEKSDSLQ